MGCLQSNLLPHNLQYKRGNHLQGFLEAKDDMSAHLGGRTATPNGKVGRMSPMPPFEGYCRPVLRQEVGVRAAFYPELQKPQQNHLYALEAHYYPFSYEYGFPIENQFQYVPFRMASSTQIYKQEMNHLQEFQYFVVIDFEATCDRDRNPHPQEIIEFPSVLVNSTTGQLEDCFQIYVRPTYNQHLSDFCKELTGIQQNQVNSQLTISSLKSFSNPFWILCFKLSLSSMINVLCKFCLLLSRQKNSKNSSIFSHAGFSVHVVSHYTDLGVIYAPAISVMHSLQLHLHKGSLCNSCKRLQNLHKAPTYLLG